MILKQLDTIKNSKIVLSYFLWGKLVSQIEKHKLIRPTNYGKNLRVWVEGLAVVSVISNISYKFI